MALALLVGGAAQAQAQNAIITGRVTSDLGQPLMGANVLITDLNISVGTNATGNYTITVPAARLSGQSVQLRVRSVGFVPGAQQITLQAGSQTVNFSLKADITRLNEIVVTGVAQGTERAKLPFTVTKVDVADLPAPAVNPLSQLQGRVPGANIVSTTGRPGQAPQVLLRAPTSINASGRGQQPLYVVDGIILQGTLPDLNGSDIESVEVVKGAAASSLYGARAGAGVIQITTKRGKSIGENSLTFGARAEYGRSDIENKFGLAENHIYQLTPDGSAFCGNPTCTTSFNYMDEIVRLNSNSAALPLAPNFSPTQGTGATIWNNYQDKRWPGQTYNAIDQVVSPGAFAQADFQVTGRFNQTNFFASVGYLDQQGSFIGLDGYQRGSARLNLDQAIGDDWNVSMSTYYSRSQDDGAGQEGASFFDLTRMPRGVNLLAKDTVRGEYIIRPDLSGENENPVYALNYLDRKDNSDRFLGGMTVRYQPLTWFDVQANASYDRANRSYSQFNDKGFRTARSSSTNTGQIYFENEHEQSFNTSLAATLRRTFGADLNTSLQARYMYEQQDFNSADLTGRDLAVKNVPSAENARSPSIFIGSADESIRQIGFSLIGDVDWKDRYILSALVRRDGASLFGPDNRWATFGRVAAAWRLSLEPWFNVPQVDEFKLRYAIGTAGNRPAFEQQYEVYQLTDGSFTPANFGNANLGPELLTEQEMGLDMQLFGKVAANINYSDVVTKEQILPVPLPAASGFLRQWQNAGTMKGNTWEVSLDVPWVRRPDFSFSTRVMWDRSRATITELKVPAFQYGVNNQGLEVAFFAREGERYGTIYGTKFATGCGDLPSGTDCGQFRTNSDGYFVWTGGADVNSGSSRDASGKLVTAPGTWGTVGPKISGIPLATMWGAPIVAQDATGNTYQPLGNTLPDYRWSFNPTATYKKLTATALVDATVGRSVYNQGRHWSYFENYSADQDQADVSEALAKPVGYYGSAGLYNVLQPNSHFVEDGTFAKLREVTLSYRVGKLGGVAGDWTATLIGRNLYTWTDYSGFDPEVGITGGTSSTGVINAFDAFRFPNLRTVTFALQASF